MSVDVVIVNWNSGVLLRDCVSSLVLHGGEDIGKIIVVDNASTDNSLNSLGVFDCLVVVKNEGNFGFGRACNIGAQFSTNEFILFLNPDAAVYDLTIYSVLDFLELDASKDVGICGVQLIDEYGHVARSCSRFPSFFRFLFQVLGLNRLGLFRQFGMTMSDWDHEATSDVDQVIGAFFFVRRELFLMLAGFDQRFFVYFEEVDFSFRAHHAGWRSVYLASAKAYHFGGGTSNQVKARRLFYSLRSRLLYSVKHFDIFSATLVFLLTLVLEPVTRSAFAISRFSLSAFRETWHGYAMLWRWLPQWVLKGVTH